MALNSERAAELTGYSVLGDNQHKERSRGHRRAGCIRKHCTHWETVSSSLSSPLLCSSLTGACPGGEENHSPATLVYTGGLLLGEGPGSPFAQAAPDPVSLVE